MSEIVPQPDKQDLILNAAFAAFSTYGYRRTSMDDIAKGAGISRSALYLHWRNKEDVFRSLAARYFEEVLRDMALALADASRGAEAALMAALPRQVAHAQQASPAFASILAVQAELQLAQSPQEAGHDCQHQGKAAEHPKQVGATKAGCHVVLFSVCLKRGVYKFFMRSDAGATRVRRTP